MNKILAILTFVLFNAINSYAQSIDNLALSEKDVPEGYALTKEHNCISVQACTFYENPEMYRALIGKLKSKQIQSFDSKKDKGSIMYFEFENDFRGGDFLGGLLWGGEKPTKEHPEEYYVKGKILIIWSFRKGSLLTKASQDKIKALLN